MSRTRRSLRIKFGGRNRGFTSQAPTDVEADRRKKTREEIKKQLHRGGAGDMREYTKSGGKPFETPGNLFSVEASTPFPLWPARDSSSAVRNLATDEPFDLRKALDDKVTLLTVSVRESGFRCLPLWEDPFEEVFGPKCEGPGDFPDRSEGKLPAQSLRLMVNDYSILKWLSFAVLPSMRSSVSNERGRRERSFYYFGSIPELLNDRVLGSVNPLVGYALLIDGNRRIRWRACGEPGGGKGNTAAVGGASQELASMLQAAGELQRELYK